MLITIDSCSPGVWVTLRLCVYVFVCLFVWAVNSLYEEPVIKCLASGWALNVMRCWMMFHCRPSQCVTGVWRNLRGEMMPLTAEFWHFFSITLFGPLFVVYVVMGGCLCLFLLRVVSSLRSCARGVCAAGGGGGVAPVELWMGVKRGWGLASGGHTLLPPQHFRLPPTLPPSSLFPPASLPAQTVAIHAWREVGWGWLEMCLSPSLSLCFAVFLSLLLHFCPYLSLPLPHHFCWESQNDRGPFSRNWSADVEKTRQRHRVSWFFAL